MNEVSKMYDFLIGLFQSNDLVNTISLVNTLDIDSNKENIYPLVNLDLRETETQDQAIIFSFRITILQQRDIKPIKIDSKLLSNTNYVDNLNETHSILNKVINYLVRQNNDYDIEIVQQGTNKILKEWGLSNLDGVQLDIDLAIPNEGSSC
jgi:hypothetical protein